MAEHRDPKQQYVPHDIAFSVLQLLLRDRER